MLLNTKYTILKLLLIKGFPMVCISDVLRLKLMYVMGWRLVGLQGSNVGQRAEVLKEWPGQLWTNQ